MNVAKRASIALFLVIVSGCRRTPQQLTILNWDSYFGKNVKASFEAARKIKIAEKNYASNEELVQMLKNTRADIVFPSTFAVDLLAQQKRLGKLDWSRLQNAGAVPGRFRNLPEAAHCIPYTWSAIAVFYDGARVSSPVSSETIFNSTKRKALAGHLMLLDDRRALLGLALRFLGHSINTTKDSELDEAVALLRDVKQDVLLFAGGLLVDRIAATPQMGGFVLERGCPLGGAEAYRHRRDYSRELNAVRRLGVPDERSATRSDNLFRPSAGAEPGPRSAAHHTLCARQCKGNGNG